MARRSSPTRERNEVTEEQPPQTVRIVLQKDLHIKVTGAFSGKVYDFPKAGAELDVDIKDAEEMLKRRTTSPCCGGQPSPYFDVVR